MIRRYLWTGMSSLRHFSVVFYLPVLFLFSLFSSLLFSNSVNAITLTNGYFSDSIIDSIAVPGGSWSQDYISSDVGGPVIDIELPNGAGNSYSYRGHISYDQPPMTCSNNSIYLYNVFTIFADNVHIFDGYSGLGPGRYGPDYYRSNFVEEDSQSGRGFAYGVYISGVDKPRSDNSTFAGVYQFTANFGFYPYNADNYGSDDVPINLELLGINTFCSQEEAEDFVDNYIFQNTRPESPDEPVIDPDFPYSYDSDDPENNEEIYDVVFNQNPSSYEPQTGDAQTVLNWFFRFIGSMATITDDPSDYRCNVMFFPNTQNMIKFDWNGNASYSDIRFNACDNAFVYALNDPNSIVGSDSGTALSQTPGAGTMFFVSLKGILWIGCFWLVFKMLRLFYYYVYDIIAYSFSLSGSGEGDV